MSASITSHCLYHTLSPPYQNGGFIMQSSATTPDTLWNKGKLVGQKLPLKLQEIWAIRIRLQLANKVRDLALFNLTIDSKLRRLWSGKTQGQWYFPWVNHSQTSYDHATEDQAASSVWNYRSDSKGNHRFNCPEKSKIWWLSIQNPDSYLPPIFQRVNMPELLKSGCPRSDLIPLIMEHTRCEEPRFHWYIPVAFET